MEGSGTGISESNGSSNWIVDENDHFSFTNDAVDGVATDHKIGGMVFGKLSGERTTLGGFVVRVYEDATTIRTRGS